MIRILRGILIFFFDIYSRRVERGGARGLQLIMYNGCYYVQGNILYNHYFFVYRVRQNYGNQGLMERYKFNSMSAINLTRG